MLHPATKWLLGLAGIVTFLAIAQFIDWQWPEIQAIAIERSFRLQAEIRPAPNTQRREVWVTVTYQRNWPWSWIAPQTVQIEAATLNFTVAQPGRIAAQLPSGAVVEHEPWTFCGRRLIGDDDIPFADGTSISRRLSDEDSSFVRSMDVAESFRIRIGMLGDPPRRDRIGRPVWYALETEMPNDRR